MGFVLDGRGTSFFVCKRVPKRRASKNQMKYSEAMANAAAKKVTANLLS
jgi:hypothetical protein